MHVSSECNRGRSVIYFHYILLPDWRDQLFIHVVIKVVRCIWMKPVVK